MPAKSRKQQRYLYHHFGADWVHKHHFDDVEGYDKRRKRTKKKSKKRG